MLKIQRRILKEFENADNLGLSLNLLVKRIREAIETQACTLYLKNNDHSAFFLVATDGLTIPANETVSIEYGKGLVGLVATRGEPLNIDNAQTHPDFLLVEKVNEADYCAYLAAPITHNGEVIGVLAVQQAEERQYDQSEEAFLVTLAAQLAEPISRINTQDALTAFVDDRTEQQLQQKRDKPFKGTTRIAGVAIGTGVLVYPPAELNAVPDNFITPAEINLEIDLFNQALLQTKEAINDLKERLRTNIADEELAIFDVYIGILDSHSFADAIIQEIHQGQWAQGALRNIVKQHLKRFDAMEDDYLRERATDIHDLGQRLLAQLQKQQKTKIHYPLDTILVSESITPAALAEVPEGFLKGMISVKGSENAHVAILARAMGVPTIMGISNINVAQLDTQCIIVDGYHGRAYVAPSEALLHQYQTLLKEEQELYADLETLRDLPAETPDGHCVALCVNIGIAADAGLSLTVGAEGVGLYRSEVPFLVRENFPTEEEQRAIYRQILAAFAPRPVIMRTLDVGGDKTLPYFPIKEENPSLGWRGIRVTLDHPEIFRTQLRAMLKASESLNNLRIMFPMVTAIRELDEALRLLRQVHQEITEEGMIVNMPLVGAMIEVPAAVYQARLIARRVDFLSVGSNDLTQYLLAVDRNNSRVARLYDSFHPAVLAALVKIVEDAHSEGKQASICGEIAGDPAAAIILLGMGYDAFSMNSTSLLRIRWVIRNIPLRQAREHLREVIGMEDPLLIRRFLEQQLESAGLGGLVRAGK
ncbi:MAG: ptsI [Gammaproteobacteria bacterium]|jgi:phosphotransferase system enzyme I (PtsP)|nr:ptsI [Gammaproteobacteria bacterium]